MLIYLFTTILTQDNWMCLSGHKKAFNAVIKWFLIQMWSVRSAARCCWEKQQVSTLTLMMMSQPQQMFWWCGHLGSAWSYFGWHWKTQNKNQFLQIQLWSYWTCTAPCSLDMIWRWQNVLCVRETIPLLTVSFTFCIFKLSDCFTADNTGNVQCGLRLLASTLLWKIIFKHLIFLFSIYIWQRVLVSLCHVEYSLCCL